MSDRLRISRTWAQRFAEQKIAVPMLLRSEEHTSELQSPCNLVCRLLLEKKKLKQNADTEMRLILGKVTATDVLGAQPVTKKLLKFMRASIKMIRVSNLQSLIGSMTQKLTISDISDESKNYLDKAGITTACLRIKFFLNAGGTSENSTYPCPAPVPI